MTIALTRAVPPSLVNCELTYLTREPIDVERAIHQHHRYEHALASLGCTIEHLSATPDLPDSTFVEDTAVVLPDLAIITRPGAESRRAETESVAGVLKRYRPIGAIHDPGTVDGGDVIMLGTDIYVGHSSRTNSDGIHQLRELTSHLGYRIHAVEVTGCLHLKSAVTQVAGDTVLLNPQWINARLFDAFEVIEVDPGEPFAANALMVGESVVYADAHQLTRQRMEAQGITVHSIEVDELAKAEAGVTCCSILVSGDPDA